MEKDMHTIKFLRDEVNDQLAGSGCGLSRELDRYWVE
jgi:hypothetical protein